MSRTTDTDSLHYQYQEADHLRREGWQVVPPEQYAEKQNRLCRNLNCLTRVPLPRIKCHYCRKTARLVKAERDRTRRLRVVA